MDDQPKSGETSVDLPEPGMLLADGVLAGARVLAEGRFFVSGGWPEEARVSFIGHLLAGWEREGFVLARDRRDR